MINEDFIDNKSAPRKGEPSVVNEQLHGGDPGISAPPRFQREEDLFVYSVTRWKIFLRESGEDIYSVMREAEEGFLDIGKHLHGFQSISGQIAAISSRVANLISGNDFMRVIQGLNTVLKRLGIYHEQFSGGVHTYINKLNDLLEHIKTVNEQVTDLRSIAKNLQFLSLATKIQSAVTGNVASGFNVLAVNVKNLTLNVIEKTDAISRGVKSLREKVTNTLTNVMKLEIRERKQTEEILGNALEIMNALEKKRASASEFSHGIMHRSREVSKRVDKIVMSMQFHDITRQKIEHVKKAVEYLVGKEWTADMQDIDKDTDSGTIGLHEVVQVSALQSSQLKTARNELVTATENILMNLSNIAGTVSGLMKETRSMMKGERDEAESFVENMDSGISTVSKTLARLSDNVSAARELSGAMEMFMQLIGEMSTFTRDMEQIESEIEVLALNAGIRAGQIGRKGAGLGKIAMNIQTLSGKTHIPTSEISTSVQAISSIAEDLSSYLANEERNREGLLEEAIGELKELHTSFETMNQGIRNDLMDMEREGQHLIWDIERVVDGVNVHEITGGVLTRVSDGMNAAIDRTLKEMPSYNIRNVDNILKELSELYTMQSERDVHQAYARSGRGHIMDGPGRLKHFDREDDNTYDDNIELFS